MHPSADFQQPPVSRSHARRRSRSSQRDCAFEPLEPRQLLTSDLAVRFTPEPAGGTPLDVPGFRAPSIVVPGDRISPNTLFQTPIDVVNTGPNGVFGLVTITFFLSTDNVLGSQDRELRRYENEPIELPVDVIGDFGPDMRIPAETTPGAYFVLVRITPNQNIQDFNEANNVAVSPRTITVERRFGSFSGRTNVELVVADNEDTLIAFTLTGGGSGSITIDNQGRFALTTTNTGSNSDLLVRTNGGDGRIDLSAVTINGAIRSFSAAPARLVGAFSPGTSIASLTLGDVLGPTSITIPSTSSPVSFTFANVIDLVITSAVGITSLNVTSWNESDPQPDLITAPYLDTLTTRTAADPGANGNFEASLRLTGGAAPGQTATLRTATIVGVLKGGVWSITGTGGTISALATTVAWSASFSQRLTSLTTTGTLRGVLAAESFATLTIGRDILAARILAGTHLGSDGLPGGDGDAADTFRSGKIDALVVARNVANSTIATGLAAYPFRPRTDPLTILGGVSSRINQIAIGNVAGQTARFVANRYNGPTTIAGQPVDVRTNSRFQIIAPAPVATVASVTVSAVDALITLSLDSSGLVNLGSIATGALRITGPNGFSALATLVSRAFVSGSLQARATAVFRVDSGSITGAWTPEQAGEYSISVEPGTLRDVRGNAAAPGEISQFLVP